AVMGLGIDSARDVLWVSTAADDPIPGLPAGAPPRASVLRVRLEGGQVEHRFDFNDGRPHEPGDLRVAPDGAVIVSDGRFGALYRIQPRTDRLDPLLAEGSLTGPQEPAVSPDGKRVLVPDYAAGIAIVSRGTTRWLGHARNIPLNGIDGLLWAG